MKHESKNSKELLVKPKKTSKDKNLATDNIQTESNSDTKIHENKKFEKDDLLRFKLAEAKYQNAQMFVQLRSHEFENLKAEWEAKGRALLAEIERGQAGFQQAMKELSELRSELEKKYSVNFDRMSYHESTGVIYEH
jgi:hypothetical protein